MMARLPIPPTFANVVLVDQETGSVQFNPIWLRWFIDYANALDSVIATVVSISSSATAWVGDNGGGDGEGGDGGFLLGPPGPSGAVGPMGPMLLAEEGEQGEQGFSIQGPPGTAGLMAPPIFLPLEEATEETIFFAPPSNYRALLDPARALDTTYTNTSVTSLLVMATVKCAITAAGGNAYVQALMDTATPPTTPASGLVGIETGLNGENNSFQIVFIVNPGGTYYLQSSATNGTVTLGDWYEFPL